MKQVKRIGKTIVLIMLIFLASIGIRITGAAPIDLFKRGIDKNNETMIELVEEQEKDTVFFEIKEIK